MGFVFFRTPDQIPMSAKPGQDVAAWHPLGDPRSTTLEVAIFSVFPKENTENQGCCLQNDPKSPKIGKVPIPPPAKN